MKQVFAIAIALLVFPFAAADLQIAPWFPQNTSYVFLCSADGFNATAYDWYFGDGQKLIDIPDSAVYHTFDAPGTYEVACTASDETTEDTNLLRIIVPGQVPDTPVDVFVTIRIAPWYPKGDEYIFTCDTDGFTPLSYDWDFGDGQKLYDMTRNDVFHRFTPGEYDVACVASDGNITIEDQMHILVDGIPEEPTELENATLEIAPWYPKGGDYIFICNTEAFEPEEYIFEFGDGSKSTLTTNNVYHTFAPGEYTVTCTPKLGEQLAKATLAVNVTD